MKLYLVGGAVRDSLLGRRIHDRDFVVIGATETEFLIKFPGAKKIGHRDPVFIHDGDEYTLSPAVDIHADLRERDLTINAIAENESGRLHALPQSLPDLEKKILSPVSEINFFKDPNRVFRAARLAARFPDFSLDPTLIRVMKRVKEKGLLFDIAAERVGNELIKACAGSQPGRYLDLLSRAGAVEPWLEEFSSARTIPAGPARAHPGSHPDQAPESLLDHTIDVMDRLSRNPVDVWMGLCHDIGKTRTDAQDLPRHHGHDKTGETIAADFGKRLRLPGKYIRAGAVAARWHMVAGQYDQLRPGTKTALLAELHRYGLVHHLFRLVLADKNRDFSTQAGSDLEKLLSIKLPEKYQGLGKASGRKLFQLRCQALARQT